MIVIGSTLELRWCNDRSAGRGSVELYWARTVSGAGKGLTFGNRDCPIRCYWVTPRGEIAYNDNQIPKQGVHSDVFDRPMKVRQPFTDAQKTVNQQLYFCDLLSRSVFSLWTFQRHGEITHVIWLYKINMQALHPQIIVTLHISVANAHLLP